MNYLKERVLINGGSGILLVHDHDHELELFRAAASIAELKRFDLNAKGIIVIVDESFVDSLIKLLGSLKIDHNTVSFYSHARINGILGRTPKLFIDQIVVTTSFSLVKREHHSKFLNASYNVVIDLLPLQNDTGVLDAMAVITRKTLETLTPADYICNVSYLSKSEPENVGVLSKKVKGSASYMYDYIRSIPIKVFDMTPEFTARYGLVEQELLGKKAQNLFTSIYSYFDEFHDAISGIEDSNKLEYIKGILTRQKKLTIIMPFHALPWISAFLREQKVQVFTVTKSTPAPETQRITTAFNGKSSGVLLITGLVRDAVLNGPIVITNPHQNIYSYINKHTQRVTEPIILETQKKRSIMSKIKVFLRFQKIDSVDTLINKILSNNKKSIIYTLGNLKKNSIEQNNC